MGGKVVKRIIFDRYRVVVINELRFKGRRSKGANMYAKANSSSIIKEMVEIASNKTFAENYTQKHNTDAKYGWYRYDTRFAIPVYDDTGELVRYNVFKSRILVRHAKDGKLYLYDVLRTKKETSKPLEQ